MSEIVCYYKQYDTLDKVTLVLNFLHKFIFYHFQDKPINLTVEIIRTAIIEINTKKRTFWESIFEASQNTYLLSNSSPKQCLLFSSGERVFQTGRAPRHLCLICLLSAIFGIKIFFILVHFILIVLPQLLYDQRKNILGSTQSMTSPLQKRLVPNFSTLTVNLWGQKGLTDSSSSYLSLLEE